MFSDKEVLLQNAMLKVIKAFFEKYNSKHDIHYKDGYGAFVVPFNYPLEPRFILAQIDDFTLMKIGMGANFEL